MATHGRRASVEGGGGGDYAPSWPGNRKKRGQQQPIEQAIRGNLNSYTDNQILDELLQNADDAKAERAAFMMDHRTHAASSLYTEDGSSGRLVELQASAPPPCTHPPTTHTHRHSHPHLHSGASPGGAFCCMHRSLNAVLAA